MELYPPGDVTGRGATSLTLDREGLVVTDGVDDIDTMGVDDTERLPLADLETDLVRDAVEVSDNVPVVELDLDGERVPVGDLVDDNVTELVELGVTETV